MSNIPQFEPDDLDWALGELFHLAKESGRRGMLPNEYNPDLFHACYAFISHSSRKEGACYRHDLIDLLNFWLRRRRRYANAHAQ